MRFNPKARLDRGQISDGGRRGRGGLSRGGLGGGGMQLPIPGGAPGGIGGVILIVLIFVLYQCVAGGSGDGGGGAIDDSLNPGQVQDAQGDTDRYAACETGEDANRSTDCARVAIVNSVQDFWAKELPKVAHVDYETADTHTFTGSTQTGCGNADAAVGPFYCPVDNQVYEDTAFYDEVLERELGGPDGGFVEAYVLGHEYGHHIQNLVGTMSKVRTQQGPESDAVRLELQADCFAGLWTRSAAETTDASGVKLLEERPSDDDIRLAIEAAEAVGDDRIQRKTQGQVNPESWTHGSAEQRVRWFKTGLDTGDFDACDTFGADRL